MRIERLRFLFPDGLPSELEGADLDDDSDEFIELVGDLFQDSLDEWEDDDPEAEEEDPDDPLAGFSERDARDVVAGIVARQIVLGEPPHVWEAVERMQQAGLEQVEILDELAEALVPSLAAMLDGQESALDAYLARVQTLPLEVSPALRERVAALLADGPLADEEFERRALAALADELSPDAARSVLDRILDQLYDQGRYVPILSSLGETALSPLAALNGAALVGTRRDDHALPLLPDFAPLADLPDLQTADGEVLRLVRIDGSRYLVADSTWLSGPSDRVILRLDGTRLIVSDGSLVPAATPATAEDLRLVFDELRRERQGQEGQEEPALTSLLVFAVLVRDPAWLAEPRPPLSELAAAAGLDLRGHLVADSAEAWRDQYRFQRYTRLHEDFASPVDGRPSPRLLALFAAFEAVVADQPIDLPDLRTALAALAGGTVTLLAEVLLEESDPDAAALTVRFADRLERIASRSRHRAAVAQLRALAAERLREPLQALELLRVAVAADPTDEGATDRLAWTLSDAGRAEEARTAWNRIELVESDDLDVLPLVVPHPELRRNDPCWCGSGRKYKVCHLRTADVPPLADRFDWIQHKPVAYVMRRGGRLTDDLWLAAQTLAHGDRDRALEAMSNPLVVDVVLHEFEWDRWFLAERGPLLPDDERELLERWREIRRGLYRITALVPEGVELEELSTGRRLEVRDRTLRRRAVVGRGLSARVLPDGSGGHRVRTRSVLGVPRELEESLVVALGRRYPLERGLGVLEVVADWERHSGGELLLA